MRKIRRFFAVLLLVVPVLGFAQEADVVDKFAIAADGDQTSSEIAKLAGIAPFFHIYDINGNLLEVLANPHLDREWGTGPAAAAGLPHSRQPAPQWRRSSSGSPHPSG